MTNPITPDNGLPAPAHLLLLGATGATGREVLTRALHSGRRVTALVRDPAKVTPHPALTLVRGDARDPEALTTAMADTDAVISALGRGLNTEATTLIHDTIAALIQASGTTGVTRVVFLSSFGVGESARLASPIARFLYRGPARRVYADKAEGERLLKASKLDWTLLYPVNLTDAPATGHVVTHDLASLRRLPGLLPRIPRADVATVILDAITRAEWIGKTIVLT